MKTLSLKEAVRQIRLTSLSNPRAFFFMTGAGTSCPEVPLAGGIVEHCRKRVKDEGPILLAPSMARYAHYFEQAYPSPADRQKFLRGIIEGKQVSQANLRLAHLLLSGKLPKLVVTTNFDDFLSRALALFGEQPAVCEHPETILKIDLGREDIQVVHVHGTYWFYDCKNLPAEIEGTAQRTAESPYSMRGFLDDVLGRRSPLVVGYSGWEGDVFMTALKHRLQRPLGYNVYWFCYQSNEPEQMPVWLKAHANVYFVCPEEAKALAAGSADQASGVHVPDDRRRDLELVDAASSKASVGLDSRTPCKPSLSAREVFDELLRSFEVEDAEISKDPFRFYLNYFMKLAPKDEAGALDTYFRGVIEKYQWAVKQSQAWDAMEEFRSKIRTAQYSEAVALARQFSLRRLTAEQMWELVGAMEEAAAGLPESSEEKLTAYELVAASSKDLWAESKNGKVLGPWVRALLSRAIAHLDRGSISEAMLVCDELIDQFGGEADPRIASQVARAFRLKSHAAWQLGNREEALVIYDDVVKRYGDVAEPVVAVQVASALLNKSSRLRSLDRREEEMAVLAEVDRRLEGAKVPELKELAARALVGKAGAMAQVEQWEDSIEVYEEVVRRFGDEERDGIIEAVARSLLNMGVSLAQLGRDEAALSAYNEVVSRFEKADNPKIMGLVAKALENTAVTQERLGRIEQAIKSYDALVDRFADVADAEIEMLVERAVHYAGYLSSRLYDEEDLRAAPSSESSPGSEASC